MTDDRRVEAGRIEDDMRWAAEFIRRELDTPTAWARADRLLAAADAVDDRDRLQEVAEELRVHASQTARQEDHTYSDMTPDFWAGLYTAADWLEARSSDAVDDRDRLTLKAQRNLEDAAREVDALFDGEGPGCWTYASRHITDEAATPLLSMHDYLNDVRVARSSGAVSQEEEDPDIAEQIRIGRLGLPDPGRPRRRSLPGSQPPEPESCGCSSTCGDDGDIDGPGTCKGLPR